MVAALGGFDPDEFDAAVGDRLPIDLTLEFRNVDAMDRVIDGLWIIGVDIEAAAAAGKGGGAAEGAQKARKGTTLLHL